MMRVGYSKIHRRLQDSGRPAPHPEETVMRLVYSSSGSRTRNHNRRTGGAQCAQRRDAGGNSTA